METKKEPTESRCARCNAAFTCGAASLEPCWCAGLPPLKPETGRSCLCRACLELEIAAQARLQGAPR